MQLFTLGNSKIEVFQTYFFDTVNPQNDHPSYVSMFQAIFLCFFTLFWVLDRGGGAPKERVHKLLIQFFTVSHRIFNPP